MYITIKHTLAIQLTKDKQLCNDFSIEVGLLISLRILILWSYCFSEYKKRLILLELYRNFASRV